MADIDRDTYVWMDALDIDERKEYETRGWDTPTYPPHQPTTNQETAQRKNMASPPLGRHREGKSAHSLVRKEPGQDMQSANAIIATPPGQYAGQMWLTDKVSRPASKLCSNDLSPRKLVY